jgi:hypothetical protein|tara:strand:+ start:243 stop:638 length:396 start_codon:yes stop_codon:yes gene_type:complete
MTDKSTVLRAFNKHFFEFIDDIVTILPNEPEIVKAKVSFENIKKMNPTLICKTWFKVVYSPYKEVIDQGDITFFFEKDYASDLSNVPNAAEIMSIIDKIRMPIKSMDEVNRGHCTKYIQNLSKLSTVYNAA